MADPRGKGGKRKRQCSYVPLCFFGGSFLSEPFVLSFGGYFIGNRTQSPVFQNVKVVPTGVHEARGLCDLRQNRSLFFSWGRNNRRESLFSLFPVREGSERKDVFSLIYILVVELTAIPSEKPKKEQ